MEERQARADRWIEETNLRIGAVEPEWWLRMMCGQLAEEDSADQYSGIRRVARRAEKQFWQFVRVRVGTAGVEWLGFLSRRDLPSEPPWWAR